MNIFNNSFNVLSKKWKIVPFALSGIILFTINSNLNFNYFTKCYLTILEVQILALFFYLFIVKSKQNNNNINKKY